MAQISQAGIEKHTQVSQAGPVQQIIQAPECLWHLRLCKALRSVSGLGMSRNAASPGDMGRGCKTTPMSPWRPFKA